METYHKIQTLFKRHQEGSRKGKMIRDAWTTPELEFLSGNEWEFTEKVDGTNIRIGYDLEPHHLDKVEFAGRSDNASIPDPLMRYLEETFTTGLFTKAGLHDVTLFGEGYGPKIQGGGKYRDDHSFVLFDVKIGGTWLTRDSVDDIASKLGIDSVPTIGYGTLHDAIDIVSSGLTWDKNGRMKNWGGTRQKKDGKGRESFAGLKSQWGDFPAEGIVARPKVPMFDRQGKRIITKIKDVDFR